MIRRGALIGGCVAATLTAGCAPRPAVRAPPAAPYVGGMLTAQEWGVGPIRSDTFFESPRIRELFPKAQVRDDEVAVAHDETRAVITVSQGGTELLELVDGYGNFPGTDDPEIGHVRLVGGPVRGAHGETLGMSWNDAHFDLSQCEVDQDREQNRVVCARQNEGSVTYVFAAPGWKSEETPPEPFLRAHGYLAVIVWTPLPPHHHPASSG